MSDPVEYLNHLHSTESQLRSEIERLRAALKPFAEAARGMFQDGHCGGQSPTDFPAKWSVHLSIGPSLLGPQQVARTLKVSDFREADSALNQQSPITKKD